MPSDNPFDALGLKKEVVAHLHATGRLGEFLKRYVRLTQDQIHPDKGWGDTSLSAAVNAAYQEYKQHPDQVSSWLAGMQNGSNPELLSVLERMVERVERTEKENEELRRKYADVLAGGWKEKSEVRTPHAARRRREERFTDADGDGYGIPPVREPRPDAAETGRAETRRSAPRREPVAEPAISREPIILSDIKLYDAKGKPVRTYKKVTFDGEAVKSSTGYLVKTQDDWITFCTGKWKLASLPLLYAVLERMTEEKHPGLPGIQKDLREDWLCTSTRINYARDTVTHNYGTSAAETYFCAMPAGNHWLNEVKDQKKWRTALQAQLMPKDIDKMVEVLGTVCDVPPYILTADKGSRGSHPERAAFVNARPERLDLGCYYDLGCNRRARRVAVE